ncbi:MAG: hypothetical protein U1D55_12815 [Phycisphaerae bacterium]
MGKLVKLLLVVAVLGAAAYFALNYAQESGSTPVKGTKEENKPRLEEKHGFTSEGVGS